jgi:Cu(I)/Ag(I) efflux system membrane protein CusA/SilA
MAAAAGISVTLVPVLMGYLVRGRIPDEHRNPINRALIAAYRPALDAVLRHPKMTLVVAALLVAVTAWPLSRLGGEFLPPLDEGDLLYMPTALPGLSAGKASEILQQTDRMIRQVPEVARVFGKIGRAETGDRSAPLEMVETTIQFKPRSEWRAGMTMEKIIEELDRTVRLPGLSNLWIPPIRNRIDMLATGIKSPVGVKVAGPDLAEIDRITQAIEGAVKEVPGVTSALAERLSGGPVRGHHHRSPRGRALRHERERRAIRGDVGHRRRDGRGDGGGPAAFPDLGALPARAARLGAEASRPSDRHRTRRAGDAGRHRRRPRGRRAADAEERECRPSGWVYVDLRGRDLRTAVTDMQAAVSRSVKLPAGYSVSWSGQFEYLERATARMKLVVPVTLAIIFLLLFMTFGRADEALVILATLPFALVGGFWLLYALGHHVSIASAVGFIALAGVAAEFGVVMLLYLKHAWEARLASGARADEEALMDAIREGAVLRVRPKAMTVAVVLAGLMPIMVGSGTGSEVMQRIAAPMVGGMITAPLLSLFGIPAAYLLLRRRGLAARTPRPGERSNPQGLAHEEAS